MDHPGTEYYSAYKTLNPLTEVKELNALQKILDNDIEFKSLLNEIRDSQGIFAEFKSLDNAKKFEIMIRCYYQARTIRDQLFQICEEFKAEKDETAKRHEAAIKEKTEKFKNDVQKLKLEIDVHKNELVSLRKTNEIYQAEITRLKSKTEKSKKDKEEEKKSKLEDLLQKREFENEQLHDEITQLKVKVESITKLKDKFEISSKEYWNRFQDLEGKNEQLIKKNKEQADKIKKLEVFIKDKYPGQFDSGNNKQGVSLDALYFSITDPKERENQKLPPERYLGYMNVNLKPTKIISTINKPKANLQPLNDNAKNPAKEVQNKKADAKFDKNQISSVSSELKNFNGVSNYGSDLSDNSLINNDSDNEGDKNSKDFSSQSYGASNNTVEFNFISAKSELEFNSAAGGKKFESNNLSHSDNNTNNFASMENLTDYYNSGNDPI